MTITRQQIESMPAGSEMDAMVARYVLDLGEPKPEESAYDGYWIGRHGGVVVSYKQWCPSTSDDDIMPVINAVMQKHGSIEKINMFEDGRYRVTIARCTGNGATFREALCRAALLAELERMNP